MSRYAATYALDKVQGPGDARPTALDIVRDEKREGDLAGKVAVITGCSSGLGPVTAAALAATGLTLYCTARDVAKAEKALGAELLATGRVHVVHMDNTDLATVRAAAAEIGRRAPAISLLINNAGVMTVPTREETKDGFELQMGTNHFAHFLLFALLRDRLVAGSTPAFASRVVNVSSTGHRFGQLDLDDLQLAKPGAYTPLGAYAASKIANIYMANAIDRKYGGGQAGQPIRAFSLMPGGIMTELQRHMEEETMKMLDSPVVARVMRSPEQGAATTVFAAVARELEGRGGLYLEDCAEAPKLPPGHDKAESAILLPGSAPWAFDPPKEEALWTASLKLVGLPEDF